MSNKFQIIDDWLDFMPLSQREEFLFEKNHKIFQNENLNAFDDREYDVLTQQIFDKLLFPHIDSNTHALYVNDYAHSLIHQLLDSKVTVDTIVITTTNEHPSVSSYMKKFNNVIALNYQDEVVKLDFKRVENFLERKTNIKNIVIYMLGTNVSTGQITPQIVFDRIKAICLNFCTSVTSILDDVHGMYMVPRDYSKFDYVIGTAHALLTQFDMGILITKKSNRQIGQKRPIQLKSYLQMLDIILKRKDKLRMFDEVMTSFFEHQLYNKHDFFCTFLHTTPNIFAMKIKNLKVSMHIMEQFQNMRIFFEDINSNEPYIRFRAQQFIRYPNFLRNGIRRIDELLANIYDSY